MEKPILFNTEMVRAILEGRKTMTRRVVKPQPDSVRRSAFVQSGFETCHGYEIKIPYKPGDTFWVRETFCEVPYEYNHIPIKGGHITIPKYAYKADSERDYTGIWKPSIHMPKEAARIWLEVTNVRVERVQEITAHECILEGISSEDVLYNTPVSGDFAQYTINQFKNLWNSINAKRGYGWDTNPWVWVVSFKRLD